MNETPDLLEMNNLEEWLDDYYKLCIEVMEIETETLMFDAEGIQI